MKDFKNSRKNPKPSQTKPQANLLLFPKTPKKTTKGWILETYHLNYVMAHRNIVPSLCPSVILFNREHIQSLYIGLHELE